MELQQDTGRAGLGTVFHNNHVALTMDLVFGLCVMGEEGWVPWTACDAQDRALVQRLLAHNPTCPPEWREIIYKAGT